MTNDVVASVRELVPDIRARARTTEHARNVPQESIDALVDAGVARLLVPREHGGTDGGLDAWLDVTLALAAACPSTGWCASLLAHLPHTVAM